MNPISLYLTCVWHVNHLSHHTHHGYRVNNHAFSHTFGHKIQLIRLPKQIKYVYSTNIQTCIQSSNYHNCDWYLRLSKCTSVPHPILYFIQSWWCTFNSCVHIFHHLLYKRIFIHALFGTFKRGGGSCTPAQRRVFLKDAKKIYL